MAAIDWVNNPPRCVDCEGVIRPPRSEASQFPGTVPYGAKGRCNACYRRLKRGGKQAVRIDWSEPQHCKRCGVRMRPRAAVSAEWVGTNVYGKGGLCGACIAPDVRHFPTVAELYAQGHPCVEPCPLPSSKRSSAW